MNLREWRAYHAVDLAYGVPFQQQTATLVQNILSRNLNAEKTIAALKNFGLSETELFMQVPGSDGKPIWVPNPPVLYQIFIPIVKAYVSTVLAQIFNERNQNPLLKYSPLKQTTRDRILTEIITDTINTVATNYGYPAVYRQAIQQMLKYGIMLAFPREEWHHEDQAFEIDGQPKVITVKEGLRYTHPHPTRMGYDMKFPLTSLNTDTGTEWLFNWHILSYGQIIDEPKYWNKENLFCGTNWFNCPQAGNYFSEIFPCRVEFPAVAGSWDAVTREDRAAYYNSSTRDQSVFVSEMFCKIIPGNYGLGDYKYPIWARFTIAGDDTVVWAEPCAYTPAWFMGYDYDEQASQNSSLGLELIPWQDQLGNTLSQMILTAKQNLLNVVFYDTNVVDEQDIKRIRNLGERKYRSMEFIGFDSLKTRNAQYNQREAFIQPQIQQRSIVELLQLIPTTLSIMERVLNISAQEAGSAASHQQGKSEIALTASAGKNRRQLTSSSVDEGEDAWKRQIYNGYQAYGDASIVAQLSPDIPDLEKHLQELGFTVKHKDNDKITIEGQKEKLSMVTFASSNDGPVRSGEKEIAPILFQLVGTIAGQEDLHKLVGAKNLIKLLEWGAVLAGLPPELAKIPLTEEDKDGQVTPATAQAMQQLAQTIMQTVEEKIAKPAAQQAVKTEQEVQQLQQAVKQLEGIYKIASAANDKLQLDKAEAEQKMAIRQKEFEAEEVRKQEKHQLEMQQKVQAANTQTAIAAHKAAHAPVANPS